MFDRMRVIAAALTVVCLVAVCGAPGKEKKKNTLPAYVLDAHTVLVLIDPDAAIPANDPYGNRTGQDDVEKALMKWGRLRPVMTMGQADLVIVIKKGTKQSVQPTIGKEPPNDRPVIVQGTDSTIRVGVQKGPRPDEGQGDGPVPQGRGTGGEVGPGEDTFSVYQGQVDAPLERAPVWRYLAKDGLESPDVPAVKEFKKAVDKAVQQQQQRQKQKQQQPSQNAKP